jgi:Mg-chelatase subunit ChlD
MHRAYFKRSLRRGMEEPMIFIVIGDSENGQVSATCETPVAALQQARRLADEGARNLLIDANGQEFAPAEFKRLFVEPGPVET